MRTPLAAMAIGLLAAALCLAEPTAQTNSVPAGTNAATAKAVAPVAPKKQPLSGAELYSMHCNRCHPERYPTERTAAQWKSILLHMQVRANLPGQQARQILKYLQENSGR